jgi:hypothetical protein
VRLAKGLHRERALPVSVRLEPVSRVGFAGDERPFVTQVYLIQVYLFRVHPFQVYLIPFYVLEKDLNDPAADHVPTYSKGDLDLGDYPG